MHTGQGLQANLALEMAKKPKKPAKPRANPPTAGEAATQRCVKAVAPKAIIKRLPAPPPFLKAFPGPFLPL